MVTEVFTRKYCDPHAIREEKVEATDVVQFAWEGAIREVDACDECKKEYEARFEPLVDYSRPFKKRRSKKTDAKSEGASEDAKSEDASEDADSPSS
ncbi:hypothetical protein F4561_003250 [Lipingzhangella halophila]|uniref:Uncharacterized protein n=1 Tax=Lipingzhangella halophila TaxID=1783352 RepID=A0A7W7W466_9ACTN|nr:hypothetical protein [Lipingzhangella halophila]MBB4932430.1 hypothetical protein [Lipingzhangella halophila]